MASITDERGDDRRGGPWRIGDLAGRTGLTVRTLHHYDEIGLLRPTARSASGHRLYSRRDAERLLQIKSLRQLGLPLGRIRGLLAESQGSLRQVLAMHLQGLQEEIRLKQQLTARLQKLLQRLDEDQPLTTSQLFRTIEEIEMMEDKIKKYYTPEQLEQLRQRRELLGEERMNQAQQEWQDLFAAYRAEMEKGTDPADEAVQKLARKSQALIEEFTGGDPGIYQSLSNMYRSEPDTYQQAGMEEPLRQYMAKASAVRSQS